MEPMGGSVGWVVLVSFSKSGFLNYVGKASRPVWASFAVMWLKDSDEMPLITGSNPAPTTKKKSREVN
jgi:hypothetical protein